MMRLFKKKDRPADIRVFKAGDIIMINGAVFRIELNSVFQLPIVPINAAQPQENK